MLRWQRLKARANVRHEGTSLASRSSVANLAVMLTRLAMEAMLDWVDVRTRAVLPRHCLRKT